MQNLRAQISNCRHSAFAHSHFELVICMSKAIRQRCRFSMFALGLLALAATFTGCVQRRFTIRSNPPGAQVYVDDYEIGTTPVSHSFIYYGTRKIRLVMDGYETLTIYQPMPTPWYQYPGIDFFSENIWPCEVRDERSFNYQMQPAVVVPGDQLLGRAEQLRAASNVLPATAVQPVLTPPPVIEQLPPGAMTVPNTLPPPNSFPPGTVFPPPAMNSNPQLLPSPTNPQLGPPPSYGPPGGYWPNNALPGNELPAPGIAPPVLGPQPVPNAAPNFVPPNQNALPPGWRPISMEPPDTVRR
jgi:hypothetical protein